MIRASSSHARMHLWLRRGSYRHWWWRTFRPRLLAARAVASRAFLLAALAVTTGLFWIGVVDGVRVICRWLLP
jgi:hypothetical protein